MTQVEVCPSLDKPTGAGICFTPGMQTVHTVTIGGRMRSIGPLGIGHCLFDLDWSATFLVGCGMTAS